MPKVMLESGHRIHYLQIGEGPDLVLMHGLTGNLAIWHLRMVGLLRDHFRVLTYDLRGHGHSDMPATGYTTGDMADDLKGLLDALNINRADFVAHSYGADTALHFALLHPDRVRQLVPIEAGLPALIGLRKREDWEGWAYWAEALERFGFDVPPERRCDIDYMLRISLQVPKIYGPATGRTRKAEPLLRLLDTTTMVQDYEVAGELTLDNLSRIQTPVHLIYGEGSAFLGSFDYLRSHLPNVVDSVLLPASDWGHFGPLEQPELLVSLILEYLKPSHPLSQSCRVAELVPAESER
jgi:pimeloyl-ACP methyl ester carboxylesterase